MGTHHEISLSESRILLVLSHITKSMEKLLVLKCLAVTILVITICSTASAQPPEDKFEVLREFYEFLMQKDALAEELGHEVVRKGVRAPQSVRLRFGKRSSGTSFRNEMV